MLPSLGARVLVSDCDIQLNGACDASSSLPSIGDGLLSAASAVGASSPVEGGTGMSGDGTADEFGSGAAEALGEGRWRGED